jgi:hypothetical protein
VDSFHNEFGVTIHQIEGRIQRKLDAITPANLVGLRRIFNSLRDGMSSVEDWFPAPKLVDKSSGKAGAAGLADQLVARTKPPTSEAPPK